MTALNFFLKTTAQGFEDFFEAAEEWTLIHVF